MNIREAEKDDFKHNCIIFQHIFSAGETYAYPLETSKEEAFQIWMEQPHKTFVCVKQQHIFGTYYLKPNNPGQGSHVCNCGYMVSPNARGKGLATLMCEHSQKAAKELDYKAMQFNLVVISNEQAILLWTRLGFETVGRINKAFLHPKLGYVDALLMYKWL